jgi:hypothetical protein
MTGRRLRPSAAFLVAAAAIAVAAALVVLQRPDRRADPPPARGSSTPRTQPPRSSILRASPARTSAAAVRRVAHRFAVAYRDWDAGRRTRTTAATLRRFATRELWRRLTADRPRPTAIRPTPHLALEPVRVVRLDDGRWSAPVLARHPAGAYLTTLILASTEAGIRVVALER